MKLTRISAIGLVVFWACVNLAIAEDRATPPKPLDGDAGKTGRAAQPIPSVKALAGQLSCTVDFFDVDGCPAFLIRPKGKVLISPMPWVWYAPVIGHPNTSHAWMLKQWLEKGIGMAGVDVGESHGSPRGRKVYTALWEALTTRYKMSGRPCLLPQSRGGLMLYNWAAENPTRVACIAGIYTVCDLRTYPGVQQASSAYGLTAAELESRLAEHNPIDRLAPLAKAGVPILHVHGDADKTVPLEKNSGELARRYRALGGQVRLIVIPGKGHEVCDEFFHCQELVDFVIAKIGTPSLPPDAIAWAAAVFGDRQGDERTGDWWPAAKPPFSFVYDGKPSETFLRTWQRKTENRQLADRVEYRTSWTDPKTGLKVSATAIAFTGFPAIDWVLRLENTGSQDSPIVEQVQALDIVLATSAETPLVLDQINGDDCSLRSFLPSERPLKPGESLALAPVGGRPSNGTFPFFNIQYGQEGCFAAIGWTGQWSAGLHREAGGATRLQAGMELTHLRLHPGEAIRTPRIMLLPWCGDRIDAHNTFRRLLLAHYLPKLDGQPVELAISAQTFNRTGGQGYWASEAGQIAAAAVNHDLGCDTLWFDAGWFEGNFPNGVGNWFPKPKEFPHGLRPVGEACRKQGLKFLVWYEPERVAERTLLAREHPDFILPLTKAAGAGGLFNLGDPQARKWLTDLLVKQIADFNIHTYRNDFNIDPLPFWRQNDPPDRQGISEIRYVEGLYAMWDELRAKFPRMYLDDCASGGRRIDLETVMRSVVQTRSDTACAAGRSEWDQCQTSGLSLYLPLHATIGWDVGAYECRSSATGGFCGEWEILDKSFPMERARAAIAEIKANRKYWYGDFYPLSPCTPAADVWIAWQLHRNDLNEGMVLAFRRKDCTQSTLQTKLHGLDPEKSYSVALIDDQRHSILKTMSGRELSSLALNLPLPRSSLLVRYAGQGR